MGWHPVAAAQYTFTHKQYTKQKVVEYTFTHKQYVDNTINLGRVWLEPRLCELYPGICLTTEEKAQENLSEGGQRVPVGMMKTEYTEQNIHNNKYT